jgi:hypothetical protein
MQDTTRNTAHGIPPKLPFLEQQIKQDVTNPDIKFQNDDTFILSIANEIWHVGCRWQSGGNITC